MRNRSLTIPVIERSQDTVRNLATERSTQYYENYEENVDDNRWDIDKVGRWGAINSVKNADGDLYDYKKDSKDCHIIPMWITFFLG